MIQFSGALGSLRAPSKAVLGGGRAPYLALSLEQQIGEKANRMAVEVTLIPSEDDGWPKLTFLIFGVDPSFAASSADAISEFLRSKDRA